MRLIRVLALGTLTLFLSSCASSSAARTCGTIGGLLGGDGFAAGTEAGGTPAEAGGTVLGGVLVGTAAFFAAMDPEDLPPPAPPSPDRRVPTPSPRMPEPIGDIPGDPGEPPPAPPEPAPWQAPDPGEVPPMPPPPAPVAPPLQPKLPPQIAPVPEAPTLPPEPTPVPPIEPVAPIPEPPLPPEPEPEPEVVPVPEPAPPPPIEPIKEKIVLRGVNFDFDRAEIRGDAAVILDEAVEILNRNPDRQVVIEGHTDWTGPEEYNQQLSESRAEAVKKYMIGQDVDEARLSTVGYGESQPVAPNDTRDGRNRNRRVELKVLE